MKTCIFLIAGILFSLTSQAQKPRNGTYTYQLCEAEWNKCTRTCQVVIKGDSAIVYAENLSTHEKMEIDRGILIKHNSGKWIISREKSDRNAPVIGGCDGGPAIIDFKGKRYRTC